MPKIIKTSSTNNKTTSINQVNKHSTKVIYTREQLAAMSVTERLYCTFGVYSLEFDEESHTYTIDGEVYRNVTSIIKNYEPEFNEYLIAYMKAGGNEHRRNLYLRYWKLRNEEATTRGSRVHLYSEMYPCLPEPICQQETGIRDWYNTNIESGRYEIVAQEFRVISPEYKIAGTIDLICRDTVTDELILVDWKTNNVHMQEYYSGKKLLDCFSDLCATSYNKYRIQLSMYSTLLKLAGFDIKKCLIVWLQPKEVAESTVTRKGYKFDDSYKAKSETLTPTYCEYNLELLDVSECLKLK